MSRYLCEPLRGCIINFALSRVTRSRHRRIQIDIAWCFAVDSRKYFTSVGATDSFAIFAPRISYVYISSHRTAVSRHECHCANFNAECEVIERGSVGRKVLRKRPLNRKFPRPQTSLFHGYPCFSFNRDTTALFPLINQIGDGGIDPGDRSAAVRARR